MCINNFTRENSVNSCSAHWVHDKDCSQRKVITAIFHMSKYKHIVYLSNIHKTIAHFDMCGKRIRERKASSSDNNEKCAIEQEKV